MKPEPRKARSGVSYEKQKEIFLKFKGKEIGKHKIDFLVENGVVLELNAAESMDKIFERD